MDASLIIELIGYLGSILVVVSMLMSSVVKLRIVNSVGSTIFAIYALIIHSYPTAAMNFCLVMINIFNLFILFKKNDSFDIIDGKADDSLLKYFFEYYQEDIEKYFPGFMENLKHSNKAYVVCCNGTPAGLLIGKHDGDSTLNVQIDYSIPAYRDCSVGKYLYKNLTSKGIHKLTYCEHTSKTHEDYMKKMGFVKEESGYIKTLK